MLECLDGTYALNVEDCTDAYASLPPKIRNQKIAEIKRRGLVKAPPGAVVRPKKNMAARGAPVGINSPNYPIKIKK